MNNERSVVEVKQLAIGGLDDNFSYLVFDTISGSAVIVDPCGDIEVIREAFVSIDQELSPKYILLTHGHGDHVSGVKHVKEFFDAPVCAHPLCSFPHDMALANGTQLSFGAIYIEALYAPGHTDDSIVYHLSDNSAVFTGDTLFIDCCGYCNSAKMFKTMNEVLRPLPDSNIVYSGHDYGRVRFAPLGEEKEHNPYLRMQEYEHFRQELRKL